jgi:type IX secretion system PorP/SprF family membrane protein
MQHVHRILFLLFLTSAILGAQEKIIQNTAKLPAFINPAFHAFKEPTKVGVLTEFVSNSTNGDFSQHNYAFGTVFFEDYNFQLSLDIYNNQLDALGYNFNSGAITYSYKLQVNRDWLVYPSLSLGYSTYTFDYSELIFQDQLDIIRGKIRPVTADPITAMDAIGYFDMGASFMAHNDENTIFGISIKHLNSPNLTSRENERNIPLDMLFSAQFGYEFDINKYGQNSLPDYSYLFVYNTLSKQGQNVRLDLYQEMRLQNFSFGVNQHFTSLEDFSFTEIGFSTGININKIEIGFNYLTPFSKKSKFFTPNSLEVFLLFDLSTLQQRRRKDFSRFY